MPNYKLYLDAVRPVPPCHVGVSTVKDAQTLILDIGCPQHISISNDLGTANDGLEGRHLARWLVICWKCGLLDVPEGFTFNVHSASPVAAEEIRGLLDQYLAWRKAEL